MNKNKIALVTGGSRGLGKNMVVSLAKKGFDVLITYQSKKEDADAVVGELEALGSNSFALALDLSNAVSFSTFTKEIAHVLEVHLNGKKIDALVNNAGVGIHASFEETTEDIIDAMTSIHFNTLLIPHTWLGSF